MPNRVISFPGAYNLADVASCREMACGRHVSRDQRQRMASRGLRMVLVLAHSAIAFEPDWQTPEARCAALTAWHGHCATDELHACHPRRILSFLIPC